MRKTTEETTEETTTKPTLLVDRDGLRDEYGINLPLRTISRLVRQGVLPKPIKFGEGTSAKSFWRRTAIEAAIAKREAGAAA